MALPIWLLGACATSSKSTAVSSLEKPAQTLSENLVRRMGQVHKVMRVAVLPFTDATGESLDLGHYMADKVVAALGSDKRIELIERSRLDQVVKELKLSSIGMVSDDSMKSLGNMLGADAIIMGSFTDLGEAVDLNCRIIEPETGRILGSANITIAQNKVVKRLWRNSAAAEAAGNHKLVVTAANQRSSGPGLAPWLTGGFALLAGITGTAMGISVLDKAAISPLDNDYLKSASQAQDRAGFATGAFGLAGLSAGATLLLLWLGGSEASEGQAMIAPTLTENGIGFSFGGSIDW